MSNIFNDVVNIFRVLFFMILGENVKCVIVMN